MKQYTHAWLAFMAIKRLEDADLSDANRSVADSLIRWFKNNKDGVIRGAWYPDSVIKDNANSHVLKFTPDATGDNRFKDLPSTYLMRDYRTPSGLYQQPYTIDEHDNPPDRCESLAQAVIDNLKIQFSEDKGSAVAATDNHIAQLLFMLSHFRCHRLGRPHLAAHLAQVPEMGSECIGLVAVLWRCGFLQRCMTTVETYRRKSTHSGVNQSFTWRDLEAG